jgi:hypothetical protein
MMELYVSIDGVLRRWELRPNSRNRPASISFLKQKFYFGNTLLFKVDRGLSVSALWTGAYDDCVDRMAQVQISANVEFYQ